MPICKSTEIENFSVRPSTFITSMASNKNDPKSERKNSFQQKLFLKFLIEITILVAWPFGQVSIIGTLRTRSAKVDSRQSRFLKPKT